MIRLLTVAVGLTLLSSCAFLQEAYKNDREVTSGAWPYEKIQFAGETATAAERSDCAAVGGTVRRDGMRGWEQCIQPFPDAGKACTSSEDCLGQCRVELGDDLPEAGGPATGTCQKDDSPFGCYATLEDGMLTPAICVD